MKIILKISMNYFLTSIAAMQGMVSNPAICLVPGDMYPEVAVRYADALIEELKRNK